MSAIATIIIAPGVTINFNADDDTAREAAINLLAASKHASASDDVEVRDALIRNGAAIMLKREDTDGITTLFEKIDWAQWEAADVLELIDALIERAHPGCLDAAAKVCALTVACEELDYPEVAS